MNYKVELDSEGWWLRGVPSSAYQEGDFGDGEVGPSQPIVPDEMPEGYPDTWLMGRGNGGTDLDKFEDIYGLLYAEYQCNDFLKDGDTFETPIGNFTCKGEGRGREVVPNDERSKKFLNDVNGIYQCENCGCDQGEHNIKEEDSGIRYYVGCKTHPECKAFKKRGIPQTFIQGQERVLVTR